MPEEVPLTGRGAAPERPIVSLLTDFGCAEPFVGLMKARILSECPACAIVDLTHDLPPFAIAPAAFWISRAFPHFPPGTVHVCIVDPGVGTDRRILVAERAGQCFLAPDNGLLSTIAGCAQGVVRAVEPSWFEAAGLVAPSATFHGRDLFAPLAGQLAARTTTPEELGPAVSDWQRLAQARPERAGRAIRGQILFSDRFGNLFSNLEIDSKKASEEWEVCAGGRVIPWVRTYGDAPAGSLVALENSFGVIEISCVAGSAAALTGLGPGATVELRARGAHPEPGY